MLLIINKIIVLKKIPKDFMEKFLIPLLFIFQELLHLIYGRLKIMVAIITIYTL